MNIRNNDAGCVTPEHFKNKGFKVFETIYGNDMGQMNYSMPQYKSDKIKIIGGYWNYSVLDMDNNVLWQGWWNSNEEFDETIKYVQDLLNN